MRFELEEQVEEVDNQKNDRSTATEFNDCVVRSSSITERRMESRLPLRAPRQLE